MGRWRGWEARGCCGLVARLTFSRVPLEPVVLPLHANPHLDGHAAACDVDLVELENAQLQLDVRAGIARLGREGEARAIGVRVLRAV